MRASRGLKWENKMYKPKRSIEDEVERTSYQVPNRVDTEQEYLDMIETVKRIASAPVQDEMESTSDQVRNPVDTEPECLNEMETVEPIKSAQVQDEMKSGDDQLPKPVKTEPEYFDEIETAEPTISAQVQDELESTGDQVPCPVENCLREDLTVERSLSAPVLGEMRNYEADDVNNVSDNVKVIAELKEQIRVLQEQLCQVRVFLFPFTFPSNQVVTLKTFYRKTV